MQPIRQAPFALRIVHRSAGKAAIIYRRKADPHGRDRLQRVAALSPLAFSAAAGLLRDGVRNSLNGSSPPIRTPNTASTLNPSTLRHAAVARPARDALTPGEFLPLNEDWGARVACFALLASGLRNPERLLRAVGHLRHADPNEAAWWLGLLTREDRLRALRALRILTEAVE
jgi:hypothetical protein